MPDQSSHGYFICSGKPIPTLSPAAWQSRQTEYTEVVVAETLRTRRCVGMMLMLCPAGLAFYVFIGLVWMNCPVL
jgi:hypothetical protein